LAKNLAGKKKGYNFALAFGKQALKLTAREWSKT